MIAAHQDEGKGGTGHTLLSLYTHTDRDGQIEEFCESSSLAEAVDFARTPETVQNSVLAIGHLSLWRRS